MPTLTAIAPGTFCWLELAAHDPAAARRFYTEMFGWTAFDTRFGPGENDIYTIYRLDGQDVGASYAMQAEHPVPGAPSSWMSYVAVEKVDDAAARVRDLGGTVLGGPLDVMDVGRMAMVRDPGGATLALWEARKHAGIGVRGEPGSLGWNELATPDTAQAQAFYRGLFGWEPQTTQMGDQEYTVFSGPSGMVGGMYALRPEMAGMPPCWLPYFVVSDTDAAAEKARSLGATIHMEPDDIPTIGRFALLQDPQGAMFYIIRFEMPGSSS
ncbi:VOC family protein [Longimicrobium sp.]|uniref:VOC family protein n=1 Tax=Longimicrobium sp. TaxID=2029185 RepID=UPI002B5FC63D|nr:VOC family protein [Longimicrobium sp.]HSU12775.1 VOC family protein [Longimicrobium sp.]